MGYWGKVYARVARSTQKSSKKHKMVAGIGVPELSELSQLKVCRQSSVMQVDEEHRGVPL